MYDPLFSPAEKNSQLEVFFDGQCPMCAREIKMLRGWDREEKIVFTDISSADFDPLLTGRSLTTLMQQIHARIIPSRSKSNESKDAYVTNWIIGVDVFREMYERIGFGKSVWVSRLPVIRESLTLLYRVFAYFRFRLAEKRMAVKDRCTI